MIKTNLIPFEQHSPRVHPSAFVAPSATILGEVTLGAMSSVWYGAVLRGDVGAIVLGARSNLQDLTVVHCTTDLSTCVIGDEVTVGHRVVLHGCTIGNRVLVGMGSIVLDLAEIGDDCLLAAGSLVTARTKLPAGHLCMGSPAKPVRALNDREREMIRHGWQSYVDLSVRHAAALAAMR